MAICNVVKVGSPVANLLCHLIGCFESDPDRPSSDPPPSLEGATPDERRVAGGQPAGRMCF